MYKQRRQDLLEEQQRLRQRIRENRQKAEYYSKSDRLTLQYTAKAWARSVKHNQARLDAIAVELRDIERILRWEET